MRHSSYNQFVENSPQEAVLLSFAIHLTHAVLQLNFRLGKIGVCDIHNITCKVMEFVIDRQALQNEVVEIHAGPLPLCCSIKASNQTKLGIIITEVKL